jgi:hypothetical protein
MGNPHDLADFVGGAYLRKSILEGGNIYFKIALLYAIIRIA